MPTYLPPVFNLPSNVWHLGTDVSDPPDLSPQCQKYVNTRGLLDITEDNDEAWMPPVWIRYPFLTPIQRLDTIECPAGSFRYYHVRWVENVHEGFDNQYVGVLVNQLVDGPPIPSDGIITEGGDIMTTEAGDILITE